MKKTSWALFFLVLLVSILMRLYRIALPSYWLDEMVSVNFVGFQGFSALFWDNHPFLYHLLLKAWTQVFGFSELATRLLSTLFSVATTGCLFFFGLKLKNIKWAVALSLFHAINPLSIAYAQETRMYALLELTATLNLWAFWQYLQVTGKKTTLRYLISAVFMSLTHYASFLVLILQLSYILAEKSKAHFKSGLLVILSGFAILAGSYFYSFSWSHLEWQKLKYSYEADSRWPLEVLHQLGFNFWPLWVLPVLGWLLLTRRKNASPEPRKNIFYFSLAVLLSSLFIIQVISLVTERALFLPRYFIFLTPYFLLLFLAPWLSFYEASRRQITKYSVLILATLVLVMSFWQCLDVYTVKKAPWRQASEYILSFPHSTVFTTRTLAIRSPYLEPQGIHVQKLEVYDKQFAQIEPAFANYENVWILDTYLGSISYASELQEYFTSQGYEVESRFFTVERSEPVLAIRISQKTNAESP